MKHRSNIEVMGQILQVANYGNNTTKTKIMYQAYLNYNQLEEHILLLTKKGLLRYEVNTRTFRITERGLQSLELYGHIKDMIKYNDSKKNRNRNNTNNPYEESAKNHMKQITKY